MRGRSHALMLQVTLISAAIQPNSGREWRQKLNAGLYLAPTSASSPTAHHSLPLPPRSTLLLPPAYRVVSRRQPAPLSTPWAVTSEIQQDFGLPRPDPPRSCGQGDSASDVSRCSSQVCPPKCLYCSAR